jgi:hypothetical protein
VVKKARPIQEIISDKPGGLKSENANNIYAQPM